MKNAPTFDIYKSDLDGVLVIHIDTENVPENNEGPIMRVYINDDTDDPAYANPPMPERKRSQPKENSS